MTQWHAQETCFDAKYRRFEENGYIIWLQTSQTFSILLFPLFFKVKMDI